MLKRQLWRDQSVLVLKLRKVAHSLRPPLYLFLKTSGRPSSNDLLMSSIACSNLVGLGEFRVLKKRMEGEEIVY